MNTVQSIVRNWLLKAGYDGLFSDECGCEINDLMPCGQDMSGCEPGYRLPCDCGDHDWHMGPKPLPVKEGE